MEIRILFEDEQIIVCEKPAGVAVQTKRLGQADMESLLKNRRAGKGELPYIGVVHRLDQPVSGVMVFAKTKEAAAALGRQIASGLADKFYYAVTDGVPEAGKGQFTDYLLRDGRTNTSAVVKHYAGSKRGQSFLRGFRAEKRARRSSDSSGNRQTSSDPRAAGTCRDTDCGRPEVQF